eukprot:114081_1
MEVSPEYKFGFNNPDLSDRVLVLVEGNNDLDKGERVHVSRMLLFARSEYFRSMFGKSFAEKNSAEIELRLEPGETPFMMDLLQFVYSMMCNKQLQSKTIAEKSTDEVVRIFGLADRFLFSDACVACIDAIIDRELSLKNCEDLCAMVGNPNSKRLDVKIYSTLDKTFEEYETKLNDPAITGLTFGVFRCMLSSDTAKLYSENSVWAAIVCWVKANKPPEDQHIELLKLLRLDHMDVSYLINFVMPSSHWKSTPDLVGRLGLAMRRGLGGLEASRVLPLPEMKNRRSKDTKDIVIEFDVSSAWLKDPIKRDSYSPLKWINGIPFKARVFKRPGDVELLIGPHLSCELLDIDCKNMSIRLKFQTTVNGNPCPTTNSCFGPKSNCIASSIKVLPEMDRVSGQVKGCTLSPFPRK